MSAPGSTRSSLVAWPSLQSHEHAGPASSSTVKRPGVTFGKTNAPKPSVVAASTVSPKTRKLGPETVGSKTVAPSIPNEPTRSRTTTISVPLSASRVSPIAAYHASIVASSTSTPRATRSSNGKRPGGCPSAVARACRASITTTLASPIVSVVDVVARHVSTSVTDASDTGAPSRVETRNSCVKRSSRPAQMPRSQPRPHERPQRSQLVRLEQSACSQPSARFALQSKYVGSHASARQLGGLPSAGAKQPPIVPGGIVAWHAASVPSSIVPSQSSSRPLQRSTSRGLTSSRPSSQSPPRSAAPEGSSQ